MLVVKIHMHTFQGQTVVKVYMAEGEVQANHLILTLLEQQWKQNKWRMIVPLKEGQTSYLNQQVEI